MQRAECGLLVIAPAASRGSACRILGQWVTGGHDVPARVIWSTCIDVALRDGGEG
jgi:hypothetical protein